MIIKSALDSCKAQGLFLGIQNLQNCDQILILGEHLERKRGEGQYSFSTLFLVLLRTAKVMQRNHTVLTCVYGLFVVAMCCITYVAVYNECLSLIPSLP